MKLGLGSITSLLDSFGNPQEDFPSVLIAGTNGKGSVTTYVTSILRSAGYRVGTFYSPHLFRINERIRIDGEEIAGSVLDGMIGELRERYHAAPFTFFEGITAAAILYFKRQKVDFAVFEVGLGGRLDATRLVNAIVTVITGISHDHGEHLGRTRSAILKEKLGIVRAGVPLVANLKGMRLVRQAEEYCEKNGNLFIDVRKGVSRKVKKIGADSIDFSLVTPGRDYGIISSSMTGRVQMENAVTAVRVAEILGGKIRGLGKKAVKLGISKGVFAGRFQILPGTPRVILDVSHNEDALVSASETLVRISPPDKNVMIFGVMARKELGRFPFKAVSCARDIILVPLKGKGSATGQDLLGRFAGAGRGQARITLARGMHDAVRKARRILGPEDTLLIFGSHLCVEEAVGPVGRFLL
ncbi:MAG: hypothetical protein JW746_06540 [Candidatus Krumholzibacteriota bacterium]|nr:hypothetical protein [Candidatus Krumholzibacteriota bacterium]